MRRVLLYTAAIGATALTLGGCMEVELGGSAFASEASGERVRLLDGSDDDAVIIEGGDVNTSLAASRDARVTGGDVVLRGTVEGRLSVAAADFAGRDLRVGTLAAQAADMVFDGAAAGDVDIQAADVRWSGPIGGDARIQAADLVLDGPVAGTLTAQVADAVIDGAVGALDLQAADAVLRGGFETPGAVRADAADFVHQGRIGKDLDLSARHVRIDGPVTGRVAIYADPGRRAHDREDGLVEIDAAIGGGFVCARRAVLSAPVNGPLRIMADSAPELTGAGASADIEFIAREGRRCERGMEG